MISGGDGDHCNKSRLLAMEERHARSLDQGGRDGGMADELLLSAVDFEGIEMRSYYYCCYCYCYYQLRRHCWIWYIFFPCITSTNNDATTAATMMLMLMIATQALLDMVHLLPLHHYY